MTEPCFIKGIQKQPFANALQDNVLENFAKCKRKTPVLESLFNNISCLKRLHHYDFCEVFKNTYFLIAPQNQTTLQRKHGDSRTCVHWYFTKHFLGLSYHFFSKSKGCILGELCVSLNRRW